MLVMHGRSPRNSEDTIRNLWYVANTRLRVRQLKVSAIGICGVMFSALDSASEGPVEHWPRRCVRCVPGQDTFTVSFLTRCNPDMD